MKILLLGYYGYRNIGDDLFVKNLGDYFTSQDIQASFICKENHYGQYFKDTPSIAFHESAKLSKLKRLVLIAENDFIAWGGGTLQIDSKPQNLILIRKVSSILGKKFGFLGVGLEGSHIKLKKSTKRLFESSDFIYLRDKKSYDDIENVMDFSGDTFLGGDLAFLNLNQFENFTRKQKNHSIRNISFSGKHWWGEGRAEFYAKPLLELINKHDSMVHMLPCCLGDEANDNEFHARLSKYLPATNYKVHTWKSIKDFLGIMADMDFHIGNRLHSIILADILGIPNIGINGDPPKIRAYIKKTSLLTEERTTEFMEALSLERIEKIFRLYERPEHFILQESRLAFDCLNNIFSVRQ